MRVCDRCKEKCFDVKITFDKSQPDGRPKTRTMLTVEMELCDKCITLFLKAFGTFKNQFIDPPKEGEKAPDPPKAKEPPPPGMVTVSLKDVKFYEKEFRDLGPNYVPSLAKSIEEHDVVNPGAIMMKNRMVVCGRYMVKALLSLGIEEVNIPATHQDIPDEMCLQLGIDPKDTK